MGCHGLAWFRWMLGTGHEGVERVRPDADGAHPRRPDALRGELALHRRVRGRRGGHAPKTAGRSSEGWRIGSKCAAPDGVVYADLFMGNSALTYSDKGYGYAMEKAGSTQGWTFTNFEEAFNQGYPHELKHFIACVRDDSPPLTTGEDGRAVLELMNAAYQSARTGQKVAAAVSTEGVPGQSTCGSDRRHERAPVRLRIGVDPDRSARCGGTVSVPSRI